MTAHLHLLGWQGLAFDLSSTSETAFSVLRKSTLFTRGAVGDGGGIEIEVQKAFHGDASITSTTLATNKPGAKRSIRISDALDAAGVENIDFLSIDVEGAEASVLRGLDFERHSPALVCVEIHKTVNLFDVHKNPVAKLLLDNDYVLAAASVINFFFVSKQSLMDAGRL